MHSLSGLLSTRATQHGEHLALSYAEHGTDVSQMLSYAALDDLAARYASLLKEHTRRGDRVLLLFPPGLEFVVGFFSCSYAGVIAVPAHLNLRREQSRRSLAAICNDCTPTVAMTTVGLAADVTRMLKEAHVDNCVTLTVTLEAPSDVVIREMGDDSDVAFLQYTSGSTGAPKGVMVTHGNLLANLSAIHARFGNSSESYGLSWLPTYHDMGLIGGVLSPLYSACSARLMSPLAFVQSPLRWLLAVAEVRATTSGGPTFAYAHVVKRVSREKLGDLRLDSWKVAFCGAEPIDSRTLGAFCNLVEPCGFDRKAVLTCYGLAEATLLVAGAQHGSGMRSHHVSASAMSNDVFEPQLDEHGRSYVAIGRSNGVDELLIVDPQNNEPCDEGKVGEIWVRGPSVAKGYWGKAALTRETFAAMCADGSGPYLRTRDRGCQWKGSLVVTGRSSDLLIVRGKNLYAEDIEASLRATDARLQNAVCAAFTDNASTGYAIALELERRLAQEFGDRGTFAAWAYERLCADIDVAPTELLIVPPGAIPRTSSGKVRRSMCRQQHLSGDLSVLASCPAATAANR